MELFQFFWVTRITNCSTWKVGYIFTLPWNSITGITNASCYLFSADLKGWSAFFKGPKVLISMKWQLPAHITCFKVTWTFIASSHSTYKFLSRRVLTYILLESKLPFLNFYLESLWYLSKTFVKFSLQSWLNYYYNISRYLLTWMC